MVGRIFSNYQLACKMALEYSKEIAENVYVYEHRFPSGVEYSLSLKEGGVFAACVTMKQLFFSEAQALKYKEKFEHLYKRRIFVKANVRTYKGYNFKEGYKLCFG